MAIETIKTYVSLKIRHRDFSATACVGCSWQLAVTSYQLAVSSLKVLQSWSLVVLGSWSLEDLESWSPGVLEPCSPGVLGIRV